MDFRRHLAQVHNGRDIAVIAGAGFAAALKSAIAMSFRRSMSQQKNSLPPIGTMHNRKNASPRALAEMQKSPRHTDGSKGPVPMIETPFDTTLRHDDKVKKMLCGANPVYPYGTQRTPQPKEHSRTPGPGAYRTPSMFPLSARDYVSTTVTQKSARRRTSWVRADLPLGQLRAVGEGCGVGQGRWGEHGWGRGGGAK